MTKGSASASTATPVKALWRETTEQPLKVFGSTDIFTYGVPFYLPEHPDAVHVLERGPTAAEEALINKNGVALLCPTSATACVSMADAIAAKSPGSRRREVEVGRRYLGNEGKSERYLLIAIPPARPAGR